MEKHSRQPFKIRETLWPIEWGKANGLYFGLQPIEEYRSGRVVVQGRGEMIMLGSYSYLGLIGHPVINAAAKNAIDRFGTGTHGARLLTGTLTIHNQLEERIARFKNTEAAIVYSSGYVANLSTISTLVGHGDIVICDKLNHASVIDGCLLSGAKFVRFRHNDMEHLKHRLEEANPDSNILVVVDAVFSMDGDIVKLPEVSNICHEYGALLMADEAHSLGVLGSSGRGIEEHYGLAPAAIDIKMGTLSKTIPSAGGYIASNGKIVELLKHEARGFVYSGALPAAQVSAALAAFDIIEQEPDRVQRVQRNMKYFRDGLNRLGFDTLQSESAIIPVICGKDDNAWIATKLCQDAGLFIHGIPSPVVPKGTARLRCITTAAHSKEDIDYCLEVLERVGRSLKII